MVWPACGLADIDNGKVGRESHSAQHVAVVVKRKFAVARDLGPKLSRCGAVRFPAAEAKDKVACRQIIAAALYDLSDHGGSNGVADRNGWQVVGDIRHPEADRRIE